MLAETIQLSGPETAAMLAIFVVFLLSLAAAYASTVAAAYHDGKGSRTALVIWALVVGVEVVWALALLLDRSEGVSWVLAMLAVQVLFFWRGRNKRAA